MAHRFLSGLSALLLATGVVQGVRGGWIHAKASFAQFLLDRSWERTREGEAEEKPWPWADTWPVARITLPRGGEHIVLAGASGRNLAFGPGHLDGSSEPGGEGTCVIAGHRDTHFSDLDGLEKGQIVVIEDEKGRSHSYRVVRTAVVEERDTWVITDNDGPTLVLVTCWPLDSPLPGGTQRYVVWADAVEPVDGPPTAPLRTASVPVPEPAPEGRE